MISPFAVVGVGCFTNATPTWPAMVVTWLSAWMPGRRASAWYTSSQWVPAPTVTAGTAASFPSVTAP